jgi:iron complex outermembrane recepter protein
VTLLARAGALQAQTPAPTTAAADQSAATAAASPTTAAAGGEQLGEVVVTATRRSEDIQKVPISIAAVTQEQMDTLGERDVTDLVKYTPGLNIDQGQGGVNQIAIRGISSGAGAATTGVYIDDTPIQSRNFGYNAGSAFPSLFDLQRVEVLRGPQGTLFGAGSEGGTVRAILPQPDLNTYTEYARAEGLHIDQGGNGGEVGFELSGPIIDGSLAFLASVYYRKDAGYIDAVTGTYTITDPTGLSGGNSIKFNQSALYYPNANWDQIKAYRFALKFQPFEGLQITPSILYQDRWYNQADTSFELSASNYSSGQLAYLAWPAGNPATNPSLTSQYGPNLEQSGEHWFLPVLAVQWALGPVQLIYNGSFFDRNQYAWRDYTFLYEYLYGSPVPPAGDHANGLIPNTQENLVQEVRFQSTDASSRFTWVVGGFYSRDKQYTNDIIGENFTAKLSPFTFTVGFPPAPPEGFANGPPFGPGSTGIQNYFGYPLLPGDISFYGYYHNSETQLALYGEDNFKITPDLTLTTGIRFSDFLFSLNAAYGGTENSIFPTLGETCAQLAGYLSCINGVPPAAQFPTSNVSVRNTATTPKVSLQEQITPNDMIYTTISKGFRPAGADLQVPEASCGAELRADGYPKQPSSYQADYVWSYEIGTKDRVGPVLIDGSLYDIRWSNIQTSLSLPICAYNITINAGHVESKGVDLAAQAQAFQMGSSNLVLAGTWGYNQALFAENATTPSGIALYHVDTGVPDAGAPITLSLAGDYNVSVAAGHSMYLHYDWTHKSAERRAGLTSPENPNYTPLNLATGAYSQGNVRLGTRILDNSLDVSLFVNNLTDSRPLINAGYNSLNFIWLASTLQPRTYGLTLVYRH